MTQKKTPFWKGRPSKSAPASDRPLRTKEQVQDEYNRACNEAGDLQYKLVTMSQRIDWLTKFRGDLNAEMNRIVAAEIKAQEETKAEEATPATGPTPALELPN